MPRIVKTTVIFIVLAGAGCWTTQSALAQSRQKPAPTLKVGDQAPPLVVEKWLKGVPIPRFARGKFYVVEFWSTWCGTCRKSMPDLSRLQQAYQDKGVTIIGIDVWEKGYTSQTLTNVESFVKKQGDRMDYVVAYDGKARAMDAAYMKAAGRSGIPCTFLVDGNGKIAWIGYPWSLDVPLDETVAGTWDPVTGPQRITRCEALLGGLREKVRSDPKQALGVWNALERECPSVARKFSATGFTVLLTAQEYARAYKLGTELVEKATAAKDARTLSGVAWMIVDPQGKVEQKDLDLALTAAARADELNNHRNASVLDTLARVYFVRGETERAIELQAKAVGLAKEQMRDGLNKTLETYRAARK
jgi:thiol-disulfide isomerase/thioredoxin